MVEGGSEEGILDVLREDSAIAGRLGVGMGIPHHVYGVGVPLQRSRSEKDHRHPRRDVRDER